MKKFIFISFFIIIISTVIAIYQVWNRQSLIISKEIVKEKLKFPASHFIQWKGAEIHYTDEGEGIPVLMIHGFGGAYTHFEDMARLMKDQYRIIRVDLPGFGLSEYPDGYDPKSFTESYQDYLRYLLGVLQLDSLYVMGNSLGGLIAWNCAVQHPDKVKKLVLLSPAGYELDEVLSPGKILKHEWIQKIALKGQPLWMTRSGLEEAFYKKDKVKDNVVERINLFTNREGVIPHMINVALTKDFPDTALIRNVQCPTLIIWGKEDAIIPIEHTEKFKRDIPGSQVVIFENSGHCPMMEDPEKTASQCLRFLRAKRFKAYH